MNSRFDDWEDVVDCNECQRYYDNSCDGTKVGYKKKCNSFVATRSSDLPARLSNLEARHRELRTSHLLLEFAFSALVAVILYWRFS